MEKNIYVLPRDRDAYSTIRGYVYQVDLTLRRWLDLGENQHLELERGEDIDLVSRAINASSQEEAGRILEQVKHREQHVTLRNPAALEFLANAVEHLAANPGLDLQFCYTTNAAISTERPCPFPKGTAGVTLWEQVRQGDLTGAERADATRSLARFLSQAACPDGLDANVWTRFQQVVGAADLGGFAALVGRFEWSTSETNSLAITPEILSLLSQRGLAVDAAEAEQLYERLFLFIFKRLCEPGIKRLTRAELQQQLAAATLSATDHATLMRLNQWISLVKARVDELGAALTFVSDEVRQLARTQGIHATLLRGALPIELARPPALARLSPRAAVVDQLASRLASSVWMALTGASDTGKSQLALLLIARVGNLAGWVRFGYDMEAVAASVTLDSAIIAISGEARPQSQAGWYQRACQRIGAGKIIVLDDLPRINGTDAFTQRLLILASACKEARVRIVSTSHHELPIKLLSSVGDGTFSRLPVPMLTEGEIQEILTAHGAPGTLVIGAARLIRASTAGHPLLVSLAAGYLRDREWRLSDEEIEGLLRGDHTEFITDEVLDRIVKNLAEQQRDLLYRLTLPVGAFVFEVVEAVAQVTPSVERPREQLNSLLGAWVQRDAERRFIVSPLVRRVGSEALGAPTRKGCHLSLAELIVRETMSIYQAQQAITHFCQAEAFDRAGSLFLFLLDEARTLEAGKDIGLLDAMWVNSPLPDGMDLSIRLLVRGLQLAVLSKYNRPIGYVLADLTGLMAAATDANRHAIMGVAVLAAVHLAERDPDRTLEYIGRALSQSNTPHAGDKEMFIGEGRTLDDILWVLVPRLVTASRLDAWLSILERLPADRRQRLLTEEDALLGCIVVADRLRLAEAVKPEGQRRWPGVLAAVGDLRVRARAMGSGVLESAAIRTLLTIHGEHLRQLDNAVPTAAEAIGRLQGDPCAIFMGAGMLGRQYAFAGRHDEARPMLELALAQAAGERTHERMMTLLSASECFGAVDADQSIVYAERAVQLARSEESIPVIEAARAGLELASATFLRSPTREGAAAVFETWSESAERLLDARDESDDWKDLFVIFAHQTSYLTSMTLLGRPPSTTASGEEFAAPIRGVFLRTFPGRVALFRASSVQTIMWMISQYATAAGNDQASVRWLSRVSSLTDPTRLRLVESMIGHDMIPSLITSGNYAEAIDAGLRYCHANLLFTPQIHDQEAMESGVDLAASWNSLPAEQREMIERRAALIAVIPAAIWVGMKMLESQEQGIAQGRSLASACRQIGSTAADPPLWTTLANTLDTVFRERASGHELVALGKSHAAESRLAVPILAYIGAGLHTGPNDAFNTQVAVIQTVFRCFPPNSATHRQLLLPFIELFWTTMFEQRRFGFSSPSLVGASLTQACQVPVERRIKAILRAVRLGVTSRADGPTTDWLNNED